MRNRGGICRMETIKRKTAKERSEKKKKNM